MSDDASSTVRLAIEAPAGLVDVAALRLLEAGASAVEIEDRPAGRARAIAHVEGAPEELVARLERLVPPGWSIEATPFTDVAWRDEWKRHLRPARLSARLAVAPPGQAARFGPGVRTITVEPGLAFGSGTHATTRLHLAWLDELLAAGRPVSVLDVGTGTGVLSIAVALLTAPATRIVGVDVDPAALRVAGVNRAANGVEGRIDLVLGSADEVDGPFDLVVANILADVLIALAPALVARSAGGGRLLLGGIGPGREEAVREAYEALGPRLLERRVDEGWSALLLGPGVDFSPADRRYSGTGADGRG